MVRNRGNGGATKDRERNGRPSAVNLVASHEPENNRCGPDLATLAPFFERLIVAFHNERWITSDPLQFPRRYAREEDREVVAFIAACFAYGSVELIHRAVGAVLAPMGKRPRDYINEFTGRSPWSGFYHRFHDERHLLALILIMQRALREHGSLSGLFRRHRGQLSGVSDPAEASERVLDGAARWFQGAARTELEEKHGTADATELWRGMRFFFSAPSDGSACKRMAMFLRWMVRRDQIDLGLWDWLSPSELVAPVDTHVARISHYLRIRGGPDGRAPSWKMALEITRSLRELDPRDPTRFDFALARLGILDVCKKRYQESVCGRCPVEPACRYSNLRAGRMSVAP